MSYQFHLLLMRRHRCSGHHVNDCRSFLVLHHRCSGHFDNNCRHSLKISRSEEGERAHEGYQLTHIQFLVLVSVVWCRGLVILRGRRAELPSVMSHACFGVGVW
jgi:hypothetical protein